MAGMWRELTGTFTYQAGTSGTVTLPSGASIHYISTVSTAGGSLTIFGGPSIPLVANVPFTFDPKSDIVQASSKQASGFGSALTLVFTGTVSYFVSYFQSGNV